MSDHARTLIGDISFHRVDRRFCLLHKVALRGSRDGQHFNFVNVLFFLERGVTSLSGSQFAVGIVNHAASGDAALLANKGCQYIDDQTVIVVVVLVHNSNVKEDELFAVRRHKDVARVQIAWG